MSPEDENDIEHGEASHVGRSRTMMRSEKRD